MAQENKSKEEENKGDKSAPHTTDQNRLEQSARKETQQPGGAENAAGTEENELDQHQTKIGSQPIPSHLIDKGD